MKKITAALAALTVTITSLVAFSATTSPASAAGCGAERTTVSTTGWVASDNLKIAGRPLKWNFSVRSVDCDGYDVIKGVSASLSKSSTGCNAALGYTDGYKFNPNSLSGVNGVEKWVNCTGTAGNYSVSYPIYDGEIIRSSMPSSERCLNFTFTVDIQAQADASWTNADPICFNGL